MTMANRKVCVCHCMCVYLITAESVACRIDYMSCFLLKADYSRLEASHKELEEVLRKSSSGDLESGVTMASEAIDKHEKDAKLYLLRAKLSFKLVSIRRSLKYHNI